VPAQQDVQSDQRVKSVQRFATECIRFSREPPTFGIREADAASAQAFLEQLVLFVQIVDQIQLMTVDPSGEHQQQVKRLKQGRRCYPVYRCVSDGGSQRLRASAFHASSV
jgi:pentose-5-phosphate-3-epimerase